MKRPFLAVAAALVGLGLAAAGPSAPPIAKVVLPGLSYQVLASGPIEGRHPTRVDAVTLRYVGRLSDGQVFSTSPGDGTGLSTFTVGQLIPGMSAALQLMRPGDRWRITMPPYLAYGPGRPLDTAPPAGAAGQTVQKRAIPPDATLVFDTELVAILPTRAP